MGLKDFWFSRIPAANASGAEYLFWYFDAADRLLHTTSAQCESDAAAIRAAGEGMTDRDATLEIYQTKGARVVYRGNPRVEALSSAISPTAFVDP
jgi:hypothetical protein